MAQVDLKALFSCVSLSCVLKDDIEVKSVHADTTSISVYGEYEDDGAIIEINHGHSKELTAVFFKTLRLAGFSEDIYL
jgi:transposase